jgi:ATP-dependent RNA helicase DeaD
MLKFRQKNLQMLVATDVAARGLDVNDLTHVINFSLPEDTEVYTHRSGRTGRAGKTGTAISLVHLKEKNNLHKIEKMLKKPFKSLPVPTGSEICGKQLFNWVDKLEKVSTDHDEIEKFLPEIKMKLENLNREELLRKVVSLEFDRFLNDYRTGDDHIETFTDHEIRYDRSERKTSGQARQKYNGDFKRLFINLGKSDGFYPEQLIELVNRNTKGKKIPLGKIDLLKSFSFFEVETAFADELITAMNNALFKYNKVAVEIAQAKTAETSHGKRSDKRQEGLGERARRKKRKEGFQRFAYKG